MIRLSKSRALSNPSPCGACLQAVSWCGTCLVVLLLLLYTIISDGGYLVPGTRFLVVVRRAYHCIASNCLHTGSNEETTPVCRHGPMLRRQGRPRTGQDWGCTQVYSEWKSHTTLPRWRGRVPHWTPGHLWMTGCFKTTPEYMNWFEEFESSHDATRAPHIDGGRRAKRPDRFSPGALEQPKNPFS